MPPGTLGLLRFVQRGLLWTPKHDPSKKIEIDWAEALGGSGLFLTTNQKMAFAMEGGIGEGAGPWWNALGGRCIIVWGDGISDKKKGKKYYVMALNGHQTGDEDATINKK